MRLDQSGTTMAYTKAETLMICWNQKSKTQELFREQRNKLAYELEGYNFGVQTFELDPVKPYRMLFQRLYTFLQDDDEDTLLIVYYGGHGEKNKDNQLVWLCDAPKLPGAIQGIPQVNWSALQTLFLHECSSPVLFLLDCCYAGASAHREQSTSIVAALAATGFHEVAPVRGNDSFTTFLTKALKQRREDGSQVSVPYLKTLISAMLNDPSVLQNRGGNRRRVTPDYFPFSDDNAIILRVLPFRKGKKKQLDDEKLDSHPHDDEQHSNLLLGNSARGSSSQVLQAPPRDSTSGISSQELIAEQQTKSQSLSSSFGRVLVARNLSPPPTPAPDNLPRKPKTPPTPGSSARTPYNGALTDTSPSEGVAGRRRARIGGNRVEPPISSQDKNNYRYSRLLETNVIRLLGIYPGDPGDPLDCYIEHLNITQNTVPKETEYEYAALSWRPDAPQDSSRQASLRHERGSPVWSDQILVTENNSKSSLPIPQSLLEALRQVRGKKENTVIWIDLICINWDDPDEAKLQTQLIPQVFQQASKIFVWLGDASDKSHEAFQFIPKLLNFDLIDSLVKEQNLAEKWQALVELMQRPYFSRRWVFLELILAKEAVVCCGSDTVSWANFTDAVVILGSRYDEVELLVRAAVDGNSDLNSLMDPRTFAAYSIVEASREHFRRQGDDTPLARCNLQTLVSQLPALQSWHPTAVIYALLPLATDRELWAHEESSIPVVVFQQFIMHCTYTSKSLDIICRPWAPEIEYSVGYPRTRRRGRPSKNLPSWIRQVNHLPFLGGSKTGRKNGDLFVGRPSRPYYAAAAESVATPIFGYMGESGKQIPDGSITVSGFVVGEIEDLKERSQRGALPIDWMDLFEWGWSEKDTTKAKTMPDHLWRTLVADQGPGGTSAPLWYHQACRHWLGEYGEDDITTDVIRGKKHSSMALEFIKRVRNVIWNRRLFTTTDLKGRKMFGLGPAEAAERNSICILHGCSVPVVLKQEKDHWILVGECFVYGIMNGEAMQMSENINRTQEFLLH